MTVDRREITENLAHIIDKHPDGLGWYGIEARCSIARSEFPDDFNVNGALEEMVEAGMLIKRNVDGKDTYFSPGPSLLPEAL
jgi:hypothetical protein